MENVVIIGSGPAAHTAAIYAARSKINPLLYEGFMAAGIPAGGQLTTTSHIENFPGFPEGISGQDLMMRMRQQSINSGTRIETKTVDKVDLKRRPFKIYVDNEVIESKTMIIATGATAKRLGLENEEKFWQKGISACAVCDGALPMFRDQVLCVIGGGDTAAEEALYLTKYASLVKVIHRRDQLRASKILQDRLLKSEKIEIVWNSIATEAIGDKTLEAIRVKNIKTSEKSVLAAKGLFYAIGHKPNTYFLGNQVELTQTGYIVTNPGTTKTSVEGVFACGDVQDAVYRQAVTAAGSGCKAAIETERFLC